MIGLKDINLYNNLSMVEGQKMLTFQLPYLTIIKYKGYHYKYYKTMETVQL